MEILEEGLESRIDAWGGRISVEDGIFDTEEEGVHFLFELRLELIGHPPVDTDTDDQADGETDDGSGGSDGRTATGAGGSGTGRHGAGKRGGGEGIGANGGKESGEDADGEGGSNFADEEAGETGVDAIFGIAGGEFDERLVK